jgi:hydrogenase maturation protein HypF
VDEVTRFTLPVSAPAPVVAVGGELKDSLCVVEGSTASLTSVLGALTDAEHYRRFREMLEAAAQRLSYKVGAVAHDLHPGFLSTEAAEGLAERCGGAQAVPVQHHHAHVAACMAEHQLVEPVVGLACDGTGYGTDGAIWGGEVLTASATSFERSAHLAYFSLPGGDAGAVQTWRPALGILFEAFEGVLPPYIESRFDAVPRPEFNAVLGMLRSGFNCPRCSSLGRLFDAAAFLAGVCARNDSEGQAAIAFQQAAEGKAGTVYPYVLEPDETTGATRITVGPMLINLAQEAAEGAPAAHVAGRFHATVAAMLAESGAEAAKAAGVRTAVLTGGCFLNSILTEHTVLGLQAGGLERILVHERSSPGDASLSLGQAYVAAAQMGS